MPTDANFEEVVRTTLISYGLKVEKRDKIGWHELCVMSELPINGKPEYGKLYLRKQANQLEYTVINSGGEKVEGLLDIDIEGDLTKESLDANKREILEITSRKKHPIKKHMMQGGCDFLVSDNNTPVYIIECYGMSEIKNKGGLEEEKYDGFICIKQDLIKSMNKLKGEVLKKNEQFKRTKDLRKDLKAVPGILAIWVNNIFSESGRVPKWNNKKEHDGFTYTLFENMFYGSLNPTLIPNLESEIYEREYQSENFWYDNFPEISAIWLFSDDKYLDKSLYLNPHALINGSGLIHHLQIEEDKLTLQHPHQELINKLRDQKCRSN